ncbi:creatinine amidohydrolase [Paenibacillus phyllosphaerae]|uniref:Creatinine amidohydrolase n=1 Tax=Paenibacillus phyllosphaerae TaxID=274593 RepID=A0A7W5AZJ4_9BACL|nr:creatininase family protein [Paenibacillus phyllosphaerae]MBB3111623.1 creatinine amidohydrolase [Paenibacillus phyllosphaerae]
MLSRYQGNAYDRRFLPRLTTQEIAAMNKDDVLIVLPVGAIEQHGPHMPVYTDTLIGESFMAAAFDCLPEDAPIWLLPSIGYGKSTEHAGHPGTITLSAKTLMAVLEDIAVSLARSGFRKLLLFNTHGGNADLLGMMAREIRIATGLAVYRLEPGAVGYSDSFTDEEEKAGGIHAGDVETSLVMAVRPEWVRAELAPKELPRFPTSRSFSFRAKSFAWVMDDISRTGVAGDATKATAARGEAMLKEAGPLLAKALMEIAAFDMESLRADIERG